MTSEERLVAQVAKEMLEADSSLNGMTNLRIMIDEEDGELPATVVSATFEEDTWIEIRGKNVCRYSLKIEQSNIRQLQPSDAIDDYFLKIDSALNNAATIANHPPKTLSNFSYYSLEEQTGSGHEIKGDVRMRSRTYNVFAVLV